MKITRNLKVPTGNILVVAGDRGPLECLSIGDYGKEANLKADFLGLSRKLQNVKHQPMVPLEEKWVVTISTQYGCSMGCTFCDVPKVGPGRNATFGDLVGQVLAGMSLHPEVTYSQRLNLHYALMGEPTWNQNVLDSAAWLSGYTSTCSPRGYRLHPVVSTMMPRHNKHLEEFLQRWMHLKNDIFAGEAGLQLSINSTDEDERCLMFGDNALPLVGIYDIVKRLPAPKGRKITLNFAVADYEVDPLVLLDTFDPKHFLVKLTPMHRTDTAVRNSVLTPGQATTSQPYERLEERLKRAGYDVIVFVASMEEDMSRITCGNAILAGTLPEVDFEELT